MKPLLALAVLLLAAGAGWYLFGKNASEANVPGSVQSPTPKDPPAADNKVSKKVADDKPAAPAAPKSGKGSLKGVVKYVGTAPVLPPKSIPANDQPGCHGKDVPDESLVVDPKTNGIKWTIVRILDAELKDAPPKPATPPQIDQKGCVFSPHVLVVAPGTDLEVLNPDAINHNFKTIGMDFISPERNPLIPGSMAKYVYPGKDLTSLEVVQATCSIHGWMKAFIVVHDPRTCAVTGADGSFEIKYLPSGKYKLNIWHEKLGWYQGKEIHPIEIKAEETTDMGALNFTPKN